MRVTLEFRNQDVERLCQLLGKELETVVEDGLSLMEWCHIERQRGAFVASVRTAPGGYCQITIPPEMAKQWLLRRQAA